jgi:LysM repeat protein
MAGQTRTAAGLTLQQVAETVRMCYDSYKNRAWRRDFEDVATVRPRKTIMKWRHWSVLIVLLLLNYIIFSMAFTLLARKQQVQPSPVRTLQPTFSVTEANPVAWIVLPTRTVRPSSTPIPPHPTPTASPTPEVLPTLTDAAPTLLPTDTPLPASPTPAGEMLVHVIKSGETLSGIAKAYGVTTQALIEANGVSDPNQIIAGQELIIPVSGQIYPTATARPRITDTPRPQPTRKPAPTPTPTPSASTYQFTGEVIWDPLVAPNCAGPAISRQSIIRDTNGSPVDGVRIEVDCYGNRWLSFPSGTPGGYEPGHYDFSFGQTVPQDWTCSVRVAEVNGQPVTSSEVISVHFDTNNCRPDGDGHQVAIVNWTKHR